MKKNLFVLGPAGSFSDEAARFFIKKTKKREYKIVYMTTFKEIFRAVKKGGEALVPMHNKIVGEISEVKKLMKKYSCIQSARFKFPVRFALVGKHAAPLSGIKIIYTSKIAYSQCKRFINKNFSDVRIVFFPSTSSAIKKIVQRSTFFSAATGSLDAAKLYKLDIIADNIQDEANDWTEFTVLTDANYQQRKKDKMKPPRKSKKSPK